MSQTLTIFYKRTLITRRGWLSLLLAVGASVGGSCTPLFFLQNQPPVSCVRTFQQIDLILLFLPFLPISEEIRVAPAVTATGLEPLAGDMIIRPLRGHTASAFYSLALSTVVNPQGRYGFPCPR